MASRQKRSNLRSPRLKCSSKIHSNFKTFMHNEKPCKEVCTSLIGMWSASSTESRPHLTLPHRWTGTPGDSFDLLRLKAHIKIRETLGSFWKFYRYTSRVMAREPYGPELKLVNRNHKRSEDHIEGQSAWGPRSLWKGSRRIRGILRPPEPIWMMIPGF